MAVHRPLVYVCSSVSGMASSLLSRRPDMVVKDIPAAGSLENPCLPPGALDDLQKAEILITEPHIAGHVLYDLPNLKWLNLTWAGIDSMLGHLDHSKALPSYKVTRFGGCFGQHMAEFVLGHIIANERMLFEMFSDQKQNEWNKKARAQFRILPQLRLGILGLGDIGKEVARSASLLGMTVWGMVRNPVTPERSCPHVNKYIQKSELPQLLESCDYVCNLLPSTPDTKDMLSGGILEHCKAKKSVFINIGRGDVIDEDSILEALRKGWISRAILDVFKTEPLPKDSCLWTEPGVFISPHVSAVSFDYQVAEKIIENYDHYIKGEPLNYAVDLSAGY